MEASSAPPWPHVPIGAQSYRSLLAGPRVDLDLTDRSRREESTPENHGEDLAEYTFPLPVIRH